MPLNFRLSAFINRFVMACVVVIAIFSGAEAFAHAKLVKSDPGQRAVIKTAPKEIRLWFNEKLEPAYSSASLSDSNGKTLTTSAATIARDDPKRMTLTVAPLQPGVYRVKYRVLSIDGHTAESSFTFTLQSAK
jgi:copper resistance protein C